MQIEADGFDSCIDLDSNFLGQFFILAKKNRARSKTVIELQAKFCADSSQKRIRKLD